MISKLSIIIPNWNGEKHLMAMLDSILAQTYKDWQAYIVDDCSTDSSWSILETYAERDNRINVSKRYRLPNGAQVCRNIGIELAKESEYICFFDSDDLLAPWCLEQRVSFMENNQDVECGIFPAKSFSGNNLLESSSFVFGYDIFNEPVIESMLKEPLPIVGWTNIYRMSAIKKYNLYWDEKILSKQDSDYNLMALYKGVNYVYANNANIDYFWRIDNSVNSITKKIDSPLHTESHVYRIKKLLELLPDDFMYKNSTLLTHYLIIQFRNFDKKESSWAIKEILNSKYFHHNSWKKFLFKLVYLSPTAGHFFDTSRKEYIIFHSIIKSQANRWKLYQKKETYLRDDKFNLSISLINNLPSLT